MGSFPLTNGDTWITYRGCTLYCRYPRKQAPILQKKNLFLFELHEISSRMKHWDTSFKQSICYYCFCLLRGSILHNSVQNRVPVSEVIMGRDRVYHFNMGWKLSSSTSASSCSSPCLLMTFWIVINWPSAVVWKIFLYDFKLVIWIFLSIFWIGLL